MKTNLKIIIFILMIFFSINFTYADNKCGIKDFQFNDIFEKNLELDYNNIFLCQNCNKEELEISNNILNLKYLINRNYKFDESKINTNFQKVDIFIIKALLEDSNLDTIIRLNENNLQRTFGDIVVYNYYLNYQILYYLNNCNFEKVKELNLVLKKLISKDLKDMLFGYELILYHNLYLDIYVELFLGNFDNGLNLLNNLEYSIPDLFYNDKGFQEKQFFLINYFKNYITKIKTLQTSDEYSGEQYYLTKLNIIQAWRNQNFGCKEFLSNGECKTIFPGKENIIIAVIDDGINLNHLDITNKVWTNQKEIPGNGIDDDNNGYIDDFNGWNFSYNDNNTLPMGNHGTAVAGIIGAESNNGIGMAGIIPNAKIMSLGVFNETGETETENIIKAVNYAIDNNADIINLSLAGTQFIFTQEYNAVFKKAYEKNIPIIVSAGNGDILSGGKIGVNTNVNKLSPVCNDYGNEKIIFGVGSLQEDGEKSKWSNYGDCVDFWTFGENIFSLSLGDEDSEYGENYNKFYGTSFSAPILSGIIGLGINKVGNVKIDLIYDALKKSGNGNIIDVNLFIDNLIILSNEESKKQEEIRKQESMKKLQNLAKKKNEERIQKMENDSKKVPEETEINQDFYVNSLLFIKNNYLIILLSLIIITLGFISFKQRKN